MPAVAENVYRLLGEAQGRRRAGTGPAPTVAAAFADFGAARWAAGSTGLH